MSPRENPRQKNVPPSIKDFDAIVRRARRQARASGMKPADVAKALARIRAKP